MKILLSLLAGASIFATEVSAQPKPTQTQACEQRCRDADLDGPGIEPYNQKLAQIREQQQLAADPQTRKALDVEEARANERRDTFVGRSCRYICAGN